MPRTPEDIDYTDQRAAEIGYVAPPAALEPTRPIPDDAWEQLARWFEDHGINWASAIQIYISRRWDVSIQQVYADIDSWKAARYRRLDIESDPEAINSYGN